MVGTLCFHYWCRVDSLVGELRSYILHGAAKKKKEREREKEKDKRTSFRKEKLHSGPSAQ